MKKKLFCVSDVHGFYDEMKKALDEAGFDENNPDHLLVGLGDYCDRGSDPLKVIKYLHNLSNKVLVLGNHEQLLVDCCTRGMPYSHDISNGTARTIYNIAYIPGHIEDFPEMCDYTMNRVKPFLDSMVDYFETRSYIFVHSFVPLINEDGLPAYYTKDRSFSFNPHWRNASQKDWLDSRWGNPFALSEQGLNKTGKTIVCGHWATEHKWAEIEGRKDFDENAKFDIYYGDDIIGIDGTTARSKKVNVLVLEDELLEV